MAPSVPPRRTTRRGLIAGAAAGLSMLSRSSTAATKRSAWDRLRGWDEATFAAAVAAIGGLGAVALGGRRSFEERFEPHELETKVHLTAYYEPELPACRSRTPGFETPVLAMPEGWRGALPSRAEIEAGALGAAAQPIAWLEDPVSLFFLQVQGSGRLRLQDEGGRLMRVGYAGRNDHPYVSIGSILRKDLGLAALTAEELRAWLVADAPRGRALMARNSAYIFFREVTDAPAESGPIGAWGRPLPAGHAIAVDPAHHDCGSLFWVEPAHDAAPALWMAMDTGAAIKGASRFDLFLGSGDAARFAASSVDGPGRVFKLVAKN
ncbi:MAG: MltA domain-containing protein [Pseudomonadota bacterium]